MWIYYDFFAVVLQAAIVNETNIQEVIVIDYKFRDTQKNHFVLLQIYFNITDNMIRN